MDPRWKRCTALLVLTATATVAGAQPPDSTRPSDPFPPLGLGPAGELWLLESPRADAAAWAERLHVREEAYRTEGAGEAGPEITVGTFGRCAIRSLPVDAGTRHDLWSPFVPRERDSDPGTAVVGEAAGTEATPPEADPVSTVRRFLWWLQGGDCVSAEEAAVLRLFPAAEGAMEPSSEPSWTFPDVEWRRLGELELDAAVWSPHVRRLAAGRPVTAEVHLSREEVERLRRQSPEDLCTLAAFQEPCRRNEGAREQLYTALAGTGDPPWPAPLVEATQRACGAVLDGYAVLPEACTAAALWDEPLAGALLAGFRGDVVVSQDPRIVESWRDGGVRWHLESSAGTGWEPSPRTAFRLLDSTRFEVVAPASAGPWQRDGLLMWGGAALSAALLAFLIITAVRRGSGRKEDGARRELERLIRQTVREQVRRELQTRGQLAVGASSEEELREQVPEELDDDTAEGHRRLDAEIVRRAAAIDQRWRELCDDLDRRAGKRRGEIEAALSAGQAALHREAQSLSEALGQDLRARIDLTSRLGESASGEAPNSFQTVCAAAEQLGEDRRSCFVATLDAAERLGRWIEQLDPVLRDAIGHGLDDGVDVVPEGLPEPAAREWREACGTLRSYARRDASTVRKILRTLSSGGSEALPPSREESMFLDEAGLLDGRPDLDERLKRYLVPFDHVGRLGAVTLALQYLVEAYPVEQLQKEKRASLRGALAAAQRTAGLQEDFHGLIGEIAEGLGLAYRPVAYYKSHIDQSELAFVRLQVSPISLSERVGFKARAEPTAVVRLKRPFFFQLPDNVYFAGHAHVARD